MVFTCLVETSKYRVMNEFIYYYGKYKSIFERWNIYFNCYHEFPGDNIKIFKNYINKNTNILEIGSGVGIYAALLSYFYNANVTCTETKPPENIFHECYIINNPFENNKNVNKKLITGEIIQVEYIIPNFDVLLLCWAPCDFHLDKWYKPEEIILKAISINKNLKLILIGEECKDSACGTDKMWDIIEELFINVESYYNNYQSNFIHEYVNIYVLKD